MDNTRFNRPLNLKEVQITDSFWHAVQETVRTEVIPYQWQALNDQVPGAEPNWCMHNFIPYFAWANRGEGEMRVWVNTIGNS